MRIAQHPLSALLFVQPPRPGYRELSAEASEHQANLPQTIATDVSPVEHTVAKGAIWVLQTIHSQSASGPAPDYSAVRHEMQKRANNAQSRTTSELGTVPLRCSMDSHQLYFYSLLFDFFIRLSGHADALQLAYVLNLCL